MDKILTKEMIEDIIKIVSLINKEYTGIHIESSENKIRDEIVEHHRQDIKPYKDEFKTKYGKSPTGLLKKYLNTKIIKEYNIDSSYKVKGYGIWGHKLYEYYWASVNLKRKDARKIPQLYISIGKYGIRFGFDYGDNVKDSFDIVKKSKKDDNLMKKIFDLISGNNNIAFYKKNDKNAKFDEGKIDSLKDLKSKWDSSVHVINYFKKDNISENIEEIIEETLEKLFPIFDAISQQDDSIVDSDRKKIKTNNGYRKREKVDKYFSWIPIYKEIAEKLLLFRNNRKNLINILYKIKNDTDNDIELNSLQDKDTESGEEIKLTDIDPFTFFACFNGGVSKDEKRKQILITLKSELNLDSNIPDYYKGIPILNPQRLMYFSFKYKRKSDDIDNLWKLFSKAMNAEYIDNLDGQLFDNVLNQDGVSIINLTIGFYWIMPNYYISLDKKNKKYLKEKFGFDIDSVNNFKKYKELLKKLKNRLNKNLTIPQLSYISHRIYNKNINYWKMSPGESAWNWANCRDNGFIAMGWEKFGDISKLTNKEFKNKQKKLDNALQDYSKQGTDQLWTFAHKIKQGDKIIANKGQTKVVGIGEVIGSYYFDSKESHPHKLQVDWYDTNVRRVNKKNWVKTIRKLDKNEFKKIVEIKDGKLGEPFDKIFPDYQEANNFLDILEDTFKMLDIKDPDDKRFSITIPKEKNMLRLNAGNFATLHFVNRSNGVYRIGMALLEKVKELNPIKTWEPFDSFEDNILLAEFTLKQWNSQKENILDIFYDTLNHIQQKIRNWSSSSYSKYHKPEIADAIFDKQKRKGLLTNGLDKNKEKHYFWITANPSIWAPTKPEYKKETFYTAVNKKGNKRNVYKDFYKAKPEDKIIFYESSPTKEIVATGRVTQGLHEELEEGYDEKVPGISVKCEEEIDGTTWEMINNEPTLEESAPVKNKAQGSLFELTEQEYKTILNLKYIENYSGYLKSLKVKKLSNDTGLEPEGLYFENENLIEQIQRALKTGKHIILNGPPGTGKSKLAKEICKHYCGDCYKMTTATSDWSTFDTIGGLMPKNNGKELEFNKGVFLKCFQNKNGQPDNKWLLLDEINRADIDKAFGALFSSLTGDNVTLAQQIDDEDIEIIGKPDKEKVSNNRFFIHPDWRIIATMNTFDKTSLYEMSYAFMRRFAFINIGVPDEVEIATINNLINIWDDFNEDVFDVDLKEKVASLWSLINKYRKIGPAIVEDMLKYKNDGGNLSDAITMYVIPQFEGLDERKLLEFYNRINLSDNEKKNLKRVMSDFFEIDTEKFKNAQNQE